MAAKTAYSSIKIIEEIGDRPVLSEAFAMVLHSVDALEGAVGRLKELSSEPGFEALSRLVPGYLWAIEQTHEQNEALILAFRSGLGREN